MEKNTDVDLEALLNAEEPTVEEPLERPLETPIEPSADEVEVSKRAQDRIRELAAENKRLTESLNTRNSNELDTFVNSIEDEPSRNLLKTYGSLLEKNIENKYSPVLDEYRKQQFDTEFDKFASNDPDLQAHKDEIRKSWQRDPSQSVKSIVGDTLLDIRTSKIKPLESTTPIANRGATPSLDDASTDQLYDLLESKRLPIT